MSFQKNHGNSQIEFLFHLKMKQFLSLLHQVSMNSIKLSIQNLDTQKIYRCYLVHPKLYKILEDGGKLIQHLE